MKIHNIKFYLRKKYLNVVEFLATRFIATAATITRHLVILNGKDPDSVAPPSIEAIKCCKSIPDAEANIYSVFNDYENQVNDGYENQVNDGFFGAPPGFEAPYRAKYMASNYQPSWIRPSFKNRTDHPIVSKRVQASLASETCKESEKLPLDELNTAEILLKAVLPSEPAKTKSESKSKNFCEKEK